MLRSLSIAAALCLMASSVGAQDVVGRNAAVKGTVSIASQGEEARQAVIKEDVRLQDEVTSALDSSLQVLLLDETVFTVGPEARLTIDRFVYDPSRADGQLSATVKSGMFRFMSGKTARASRDAVSIDTPVASLGVRGTVVEGLVGRDAIALARQLGLVDPSVPLDPDGATLFVLRGPGPAKNSRDRRGEIEVSTRVGAVTLNQPGQAVFVANRDTLPSRPIRMTLAQLSLFDDRLRTEPGLGPSFRPFDVDVDLPRRKRRLDPVAEPFDPLADLDWPEADVFGGECPC